MVRSLKVVSKWSQSVSNADICGLKGVSKCWQCCHLESQRSFKVLAALASGVSTGFQRVGTAGIWSFKGLSKYWQQWHLESQRGLKVVSKWWQWLHLGSRRGLKVVSKWPRSAGSACIWSLKGLSTYWQQLHLESQRGLQAVSKCWQLWQAWKRVFCIVPREFV
jgi:hypothetical protein